MPIKVTCPKCQGVLHAPDDAGGKRGKCPTCGTVLAIPAAGGSGLLPPPPAAVERPAEPAFKPTTASRTTFAEEPPSVGPGADMRQSQFGSMARPEVEPRKQSAGKLPPPSFAAEPARNQPADPFSRPGRPPVAAPEDAVRGWKRAKSGLWWVRFGQFLFTLGILAPAGIAIAENYGTALPNQMPGYLKVEGLSSAMEIRAGALLVPTVLGLFFTTIGRFGVGNAPRSSYSRGLAKLAALATLFVLLGVIAFLAPGVAQVFQTAIIPDGLKLGLVAEEPAGQVWGKLIGSVLPSDEPTGMIQRGGLLVAVIAVLLAEVWFASALGRMGAALESDTLAGRSTRFLFLTGMLAAALTVGIVGYLVYTAEVNDFLRNQFVPNWNKLEAHRATVRCGLVILGGLILLWWNARLTGAARKAIRGWLDQNEPATV
jgi:hypothetical protein